MCAPFSTCGTPGISKQPHPEGDPCKSKYIPGMYMYQLHFFCTWPCISLPTAGLFSRSRLRGTQGARVYTINRRLGPGRASWRALWAFKVGESWLFSRDRCAPSQSQAGRWKSTQENDFFSSALAVYNSSHLRDSHVTRAASLQDFSFVVATNDASACVCVCANVRVCRRTFQELGT